MRAASTPEPVRRIDVEQHVLELMRAAVSGSVGRHVQIRLSAEQILLSGHVATWHQKQNAQECIRNLSSGRKILNRIAVHPTQQLRVQ